MIIYEIKTTTNQSYNEAQFVFVCNLDFRIFFDMIYFSTDLRDDGRGCQCANFQFIQIKVKDFISVLLQVQNIYSDHNEF